MEAPGGSGDRAVPRRDSVAYLLVQTLAFLSELAMLGTLGVAGWHFGAGGLMSVAMAVLYPALVVLIWSVWLAPRGARRLPDPWRLILQIVLFLVTGVVSALAGRVVLGVIVAAVGIAAFVAARLFDDARVPRHSR